MSASSRLLKICNSVPMANLAQGGSLTIRSVLPQTQLIIRPEWRNDGHLSLEQHRPQQEADLIVRQEENMVTSLGRSEAHWSVRLQPKKMLHERKTFEPSVQPTHQAIDHVVEDEDTAMSRRKVILDDGTILPDSSDWQPPPEGMTRVEYNDGISHIKKSNNNLLDIHDSDLSLIARVPEKLNLICEANDGGSIVVENKLEGDTRLVTTNGNVRVKKLRGHQIFLETKTFGSTIHASDLLEAENLIVLTRGRFRAQRIQGDHVNISANHQGDDCQGSSFVQSIGNFIDNNDHGAAIDISALYTSGEGGASLRVASTSINSLVHVKSNHGHLQVAVGRTFDPSTDRAPDTCVNGANVGPIVNLGGVNGSCNVCINIDGGNREKLFAGRIHIDNLAPNSISLVAATFGDVILSLDQNLEAELRLLSAVDADSMCMALLSGDSNERLQSVSSFAEQRKEDAKNDILIRLNSFKQKDTGVPQTKRCMYIEGRLLSNPNNRKGFSSGGKIRLDAAANQALHEFDSARKEEGRDSLPILVVATNGKIEVDTLSWKEAIARKFGVERRLA